MPKFRQGLFSLVLAITLVLSLFSFLDSRANAVASCAEGGACSIGDVGPGGGLVFFYSSSGFSAGGVSANFLEMAPRNWYQAIAPAEPADDPNLPWAMTTDSLTSITRDQIGAGKQNTIDLIAMKPLGADTVTAVTASNLYPGSDSSTGSWYLPAKSELNEMCKYLHGQATGDTSTACSGSLTNSDYLYSVTSNQFQSSTDYNFQYAWIQYLGDGSTSGARKVYDTRYTDRRGNPTGYMEFGVRPIRAFHASAFNGVGINRPAATPVLVNKYSISNGFRVQVENLNSLDALTETVTVGEVAVRNFYNSSITEIEVTGLSPGASSTLTVYFSRFGYQTSSVSTSGSAVASHTLIAAQTTFSDTMTDISTGQLFDTSTPIAQISEPCADFKPYSAVSTTTINDVYQSDTATYLLWSSYCGGDYFIPTRIYLSKKVSGNWSTQLVTTVSPMYVGNYYGTPRLVPLTASSVGILWLGDKPVGENYVPISYVTVANGTVSGVSNLGTLGLNCQIGSLNSFQQNGNSYILFQTDNGGAETCMSDIYILKYSSGTWSAPLKIYTDSKMGSSFPEFINHDDLNQGPKHVTLGDGSILFCVTKYSRHSNTEASSNGKLSLVKFLGDTATTSVLKTYSASGETGTTPTNCSFGYDRDRKLHLLINEDSYLYRSYSGGEGTNYTPSISRDYIYSGSDFGAPYAVPNTRSNSTQFFCTNCYDLLAYEKNDASSYGEFTPNSLYQFFDGVWAQMAEPQIIYGHNDDDGLVNYISTDLWSNKDANLVTLRMHLTLSPIEITNFKFNNLKVDEAIDDQRVFISIYPDGSAFASESLAQRATAVFNKVNGTTHSYRMLARSMAPMRKGNSIFSQVSDGSKSLIVESLMKAVPPRALEVSPEVTNVSTTSATVKFNAVPNATGYALKVFRDDGSDLRVLASIDTETVVRDLSPGTDYNFLVIAQGNGINFFNGSSIAIGKTNSLPITPAYVPSGGFVPAPAPTPTPSPTSTPTPSPTKASEESKSPSPVPTLAPSQTAKPIPSPTPKPKATPSPTSSKAKLPISTSKTGVKTSSSTAANVEVTKKPANSAPSANSKSQLPIKKSSSLPKSKVATQSPSTKPNVKRK